MIDQLNTASPATLISLLASGATAGGSLIEEGYIGIRTVCAVGVTVFTGVWWLSRKLTQIEDRLATGDQRFDRIEKNQKRNFDNLTATLSRLPCHKEECTSETKPNEPS